MWQNVIIRYLTYSEWFLCEPHNCDREPSIEALPDSFSPVVWQVLPMIEPSPVWPLFPSSLWHKCIRNWHTSGPYEPLCMALQKKTLSSRVYSSANAAQSLFFPALCRQTRPGISTMSKQWQHSLLLTILSRGHGCHIGYMFLQQMSIRLYLFDPHPAS